MDSRYLEKLLELLRERQAFYSTNILSGSLSFEDFKHMCGKHYAICEAERIAKKLYKDMCDISAKEELAKGDAEYGERY